MSSTDTNLYEGLFLMNQSEIAGDSAAAVAHVQEMLDRVEAETLSLGKWDERKLAYPVQGQKRGTYLIAYFNARPSQIANIERDCNLSESVMRVMMTRCDHMGDDELKAALEGGSARKDAEAVAAAGEPAAPADV